MAKSLGEVEVDEETKQKINNYFGASATSGSIQYPPRHQVYPRQEQEQPTPKEKKTFWRWIYEGIEKEARPLGFLVANVVFIICIAWSLAEVLFFESSVPLVWIGLIIVASFCLLYAFFTLDREGLLV